jgi:hypothetical protein
MRKVKKTPRFYEAALKASAERLEHMAIALRNERALYIEIKSKHDSLVISNKMDQDRIQDLECKLMRAEGAQAVLESLLESLLKNLLKSELPSSSLCSRCRGGREPLRRVE